MLRMNLLTKLALATLAASLAACDPAPPGPPTTPEALIEHQERQRELAPDVPPATEDGPIPGPGAPISPGQTHRFQCGDMQVEAVFSAQAVELDINGRRLHLPAQPSDEHEVRFADEETVLTARGIHRAALTLDGQTHPCTSIRVRSPWGQAADRGVGFRAVGNEPGWHVEVDRGESPRLHALLDYGERTLTVERSEAIEDLEDGVSGYRGEADGETVELHIHREPCEDPMSGDVFEARAILSVNGQTYEGCGLFLLARADTPDDTTP